MINPTGLAEIKIETLETLLRTFYLPKHKDRVLTRLLEVVPHIRSLNSIDGISAISIDPPKLFNFIK